MIFFIFITYYDSVKIFLKIITREISYTIHLFILINNVINQNTYYMKENKLFILCFQSLVIYFYIFI